MTCASMPAEVVVATGIDPLSWWLLVALIVILTVSMICCLGCFLYVLKLKKAARVNDAFAHSPAAVAATVVEATPLLELTDAEVQREIRIRMRPEMDQAYHFCPAGEKYHLDGCTVTSGNRRSFALLPCPVCTVGRCNEMDEAARPQVFFANTRQEPYGSGLHYHVDRFCRGRPATLYEKTMCQHCRIARNNQMFGLRMQIKRPYLDQQISLGQWSPILFAGHVQ
jgi:hypothetical protein